MKKQIKEVNRFKRTFYMRSGISLILLMLISVTTFSQSVRKNQRLFEQAKQSYSMQDYPGAADLCQQILKNTPEYLDARLLLADIFHETGNVSQEIFHLKKALELSPMPLIHFRLGEALHSQEKYEDALENYNEYLKTLKPGTEQEARIQRKIKNCRFAIDAMKNPVDYSPRRLPNTVNTPDDEYWPSLSIDQKTLFFTRLVKKPGELPQEDFFVSQLGEEGWENATPLTEINTPENEGAQCLSADGNLLFFTACNRPSGLGSCDIYYSVRKKGIWSAPINAGKPVNTPGWEAQPSISSDGRFLYFSSNRPGGKGKKDIWRVELQGFDQNGKIKWGEPYNPGDSINTPGDETSPFVHPGNKNFYFASDYHTGMGGFDMFMSEIIDDSLFSAPVNLGYPLNSINDEQGLHISADGLTAFFSSQRDTLMGIDIYSFQLDESIRPHPATYVKAQVFDAQSGNPVQSEVELVNLSGKNEKPQTEKTDADGELLLCLPVGSNYSFSVEKKGYLFYSGTFDLRDSKKIYNPYELEIALTPVVAGAEMHLYNIYFETDSFRILPESEPELQKLTQFLKDNPLLKVEIQGHTDNTGLEDKNLVLSEKRAHSVVEYLVENKIDNNRLSWRGYGEKRPVAENETPEGRRMNRRTTIRIE